MTVKDDSLRLINEKAGFGLARAAWVRTLQSIRSLPTKPA